WIRAQDIDFAEGEMDVITINGEGTNPNWLLGENDTESVTDFTIPPSSLYNQSTADMRLEATVGTWSTNVKEVHVEVIVLNLSYVPYDNAISLVRSPAEGYWRPGSDVTLTSVGLLPPYIPTADMPWQEGGVMLYEVPVWVVEREYEGQKAWVTPEFAGKPIGCNSSPPARSLVLSSECFAAGDIFKGTVALRNPADGVTLASAVDYIFETAEGGGSLNGLSTGASCGVLYSLHFLQLDGTDSLVDGPTTYDYYHYTAAIDSPGDCAIQGVFTWGLTAGDGDVAFDATFSLPDGLVFSDICSVTDTAGTSFTVTCDTSGLSVDTRFFRVESKVRYTQGAPEFSGTDVRHSVVFSAHAAYDQPSVWDSVLFETATPVGPASMLALPHSKACETANAVFTIGDGEGGAVETDLSRFVSSGWEGETTALSVTFDSGTSQYSVSTTAVGWSGTPTYMVSLLDESVYSEAVGLSYYDPSSVYTVPAHVSPGSDITVGVAPYDHCGVFMDGMALPIALRTSAATVTPAAEGVYAAQVVYSAHTLEIPDIYVSGTVTEVGGTTFYPSSSYSASHIAVDGIVDIGSSSPLSFSLCDVSDVPIETELDVSIVWLGETYTTAVHWDSGTYSYSLPAPVDISGAGPNTLEIIIDGGSPAFVTMEVDAAVSVDPGSGVVWVYGGSDIVPLSTDNAMACNPVSYALSLLDREGTVITDDLSPSGDLTAVWDDGDTLLPRVDVSYEGLGIYQLHSSGPGPAGSHVLTMYVDDVEVKSLEITVEQQFSAAASSVTVGSAIGSGSLWHEMLVGDDVIITLTALDLCGTLYPGPYSVDIVQDGIVADTVAVPAAGYVSYTVREQGKFTIRGILDDGHQAFTGDAFVYATPFSYTDESATHFISVSESGLVGKPPIVALGTTALFSVILYSASGAILSSQLPLPVSLEWDTAEVDASSVKGRGPLEPLDSGIGGLFSTTWEATSGVYSLSVPISSDIRYAGTHSMSLYIGDQLLVTDTLTFGLEVETKTGDTVWLKGVHSGSASFLSETCGTTASTFSLLDMDRAVVTSDLSDAVSVLWDGDRTSPITAGDLSFGPDGVYTVQTVTPSAPGDHTLSVLLSSHQSDISVARHRYSVAQLLSEVNTYMELPAGRHRTARTQKTMHLVAGVLDRCGLPIPDLSVTYRVDHGDSTDVARGGALTSDGMCYGCDVAVPRGKSLVSAVVTQSYRGTEVSISHEESVQILCVPVRGLVLLLMVCGVLLPAFFYQRWRKTGLVPWASAVVVKLQTVKVTSVLLNRPNAPIGQAVPGVWARHTVPVTVRGVPHFLIPIIVSDKDQMNKFKGEVERLGTLSNIPGLVQCTGYLDAGFLTECREASESTPASKSPRGTDGLPTISERDIPPLSILSGRDKASSPRDSTSLSPLGSSDIPPLSSLSGPGKRTRTGLSARDNTSSLSPRADPSLSPLSAGGSPSFSSLSARDPRTPSSLNSRDTLDPFSLSARDKLAPFSLSARDPPSPSSLSARDRETPTGMGVKTSRKRETLADAVFKACDSVSPPSESEVAAYLFRVPRKSSTLSEYLSTPHSADDRLFVCYQLIRTILECMRRRITLSSFDDGVIHVDSVTSVVYVASHTLHLATGGDSSVLNLSVSSFTLDKAKEAASVAQGTPRKTKGVYAPRDSLASPDATLGTSDIDPTSSDIASLLSQFGAEGEALSERLLTSDNLASRRDLITGLERCMSGLQRQCACYPTTAHRLARVPKHTHTVMRVTKDWSAVRGLGFVGLKPSHADTLRGAFARVSILAINPDTLKAYLYQSQSTATVYGRTLPSQTSDLLKHMNRRLQYTQTQEAEATGDAEPPSPHHRIVAYLGCTGDVHPDRLPKTHGPMGKGIYLTTSVPAAITAAKAASALVPGSIPVVLCCEVAIGRCHTLDPEYQGHTGYRLLSHGKSPNYETRCTILKTVQDQSSFPDSTEDILYAKQSFILPYMRLEVDTRPNDVV
ncbi:hypothetical protein KIPB_006049, partial [Kipferlia bialata]